MSDRRLGWSMGAETEQRQPEWERQIESLGQGEAELHQRQLRLLREQTSTFIRDLGNLQQEVASLRAQRDADRLELTTSLQTVAAFERALPSTREELDMLRGQVTTLESKLVPYVDELKTTVQRDLVERAGAQTRLEGRCGDLAEIVSKHAQLHQDAERRLAQQIATGEAFEASNSRLMELLSQQGDQVSSLQSLYEHAKAKQELDQGLLADRLDRLEADLPPSTRTQLSTLQSDFCRLRDLVESETLTERILSAAKRHAEDEKILLQKSLQASVASLSERVDSLESAQLLEVKTALGRIDQMQTRIREHHSQLAHHATMQADHHSQLAHHATMQDRLISLEQRVGDSVDRHSELMSAAQAREEELHGRLSKCEKQGHELQRGQDRLTSLEQRVGDSADRHSELMSAAQARQEELHGRLSKCEKQGHELQRGQAQHATMAERLDYLERTFGESVGKHSAELEGIKALHARQESVQAKRDREAEAAQAMVKDHHATLLERLDYLEKVVGDSADGHSREIEALKVAHARHDAVHTKHVKELDAMKAGHASHQASMAERLEYIERLLDTSKEAHDDHVQASGQRLDSVHGRLALCEAYGSSIADIKKILNVLTNDRPVMKDRVDALENQLGELEHKHATDLQTTHSQLDSVHGRLLACEKLGTSFGDLKRAHSTLAGEKAALDNHHSTLAERVEYLESAIGDSADKHVRELESLKALHSKHAKELDSVKAAQTQHATVSDRLDHLEAALNDAVEQHSARLAAAHTKVDQLQTRVSTCEGYSAAITDMKRSHGSLANENAALHTHQATLLERIDEVENIFAKSTDKQTKNLANVMAKVDQMSELKGAHSRLASESAARDRGHTSLTERVDQLEGALREHSDGHAREFEALKANHAKHAKALDAAKSGSSQQALLANRVEALETAHGDVVDRHSNELVSAHSKLEQLLGRLAACEAHGSALGELKRSHAGLKDEKTNLDRQHGSLKDRVEALDSMLRDTADAHAKELQEAKAALNSLHGRLQSCEKHGPTLTELERSHASLAGLKATHEAQHSSVKDRVELLEQSLGGAIEELEKLRGELSDERMKSGAALGELRKSQATSSANDRATFEWNHKGISDRFTLLEKLVGDFTDSHGKHLQDVQAACAKMAADSRDQARSALEDLAEQVIREMREGNAREEALKKRLESLEACVGSSGKPSGFAEELVPTRAAAVQPPLSPSHYTTSTLSDRVDYVERLLGVASDRHAELADRHSQGMAATQDVLRDLNGKLAEERAARDAHRDAVRQHLAAEREASESQQLEVRQRVQALEVSAAEEMERHLKQLQGVEAAYNRVAHAVKEREEQHEHLMDGFEQLQARVEGAVATHGESAVSVQAALEAMSARLAEFEGHGSAIGDLKKAHQVLLGDLRGGFEGHGSAIGDFKKTHQGLLGDLRSSLEAQLAALVERLEAMEAGLDESAEQHGRALQGVKSVHVQLASDAKARDTAHASLAERLAQLEEELGQAGDRHAESLATAGAKLDQLLDRVAACEAGAGALAEVRKAHSSVLQDRSTFAAQHAAVTDRVDALQTALDALSGRHASQSGAVEAAVVKVEQSQARLAELEFQYSSLGRELPKALGDVQGKMDEWETKMETLGKQQRGPSSAALESHRATVAALEAELHERLDRVEGALDEVAAMQSQGINGMQAEVRQLKEQLLMLPRLERSHAELASARTDLDGRHGALEERVAQLEMASRGVAEVELLVTAHARLEGEARANHERLKGEVAAEQEARLALQEALEGRICRLDGGLRDRFDAGLRELSASVRQPPSGSMVEAKEVEDLREQLEMERKMREQQQDLVQEMIEGEKRAREAFERGLNGSLAEQKKAMNQHERLMEERLVVERSARERQGEQLQEKLTEERFAIERSMRDFSSEQLQEYVGQERRATSRVEGAVVDEDRLHVLQRNVSSAEILIRREIEDRLKENRRIWDAIDLHTHDLSTQVLVEDDHPAAARGKRISPPRARPGGAPAGAAIAPSDEVADEGYLPFPCQPLTSFLRLSGHGAMLSEGEENIPRGARQQNLGGPGRRRSR